MNKWLFFVSVGLLGLFVPSSLFALPLSQSRVATSGDAVLSLGVLESEINGNERSTCSVTLRVKGDRVPVTVGDTAEIIVYRDTGWFSFDEVLWEHTYTLSSPDPLGAYQKTFDCSSSLGSYAEGEVVHVYAWARVVKSQCTGICLYDRPQTDSAAIVMLNDDQYEPDNTSAQANQLGLGMSSVRIARDQDWMYFSIHESAEVTLYLHYHGDPQLDMAIVQSNGTVLFNSDDGIGRSYIERALLHPGTYYVRVSPRVQGHYDFYQIQFLYSTVDVTCIDSSVDSQPCGHCGVRTRTCTGGSWSEWSDCQSEGVCQQGDTRQSPCGNCGTRTETCNSSCQWGEGTCSNEGPCSAGATEERVCGSGGSQQRRCDTNCQWLDYDECLVEKRLGDTCSADSDCVDMWQCVRAPQDPQFVNGYCGFVGCRSDEECGHNALCSELFGKTYCLKKCIFGYDCRSEYLCEGDAGRKVCIPPCSTDQDCGGANEECSQLSGTCVDKQVTGDDSTLEVPGSDSHGEVGLTDPTTPGAETGGCACSSTHNSNDLPFSALAIVTIWAAAITIRRRRMQL